ncbi:guanylin-like [Betta splendens]|uniref:Guanylate cyclase activator 2B n=1 Tax=Betta splendens TaxID=158456 RepID=A0A6P7MII2_BETSP|nr:guanylin-like [Betta splendens]
MKAALTTACLLILALGWTAEAVQVQENGLSFSLDAVRRLQELQESSKQQNPRFRSSAVWVCADPLLPQELLPLCKQRTSSASFARLAAVPIDVCEICAFAACTGC